MVRPSRGLDGHSQMAVLVSLVWGCKRTTEGITNPGRDLHRGQTSRAVFRFISRHFIHREVETRARMYIIAVESKCIPISLT